jgi:hypothetical protein
MAETSQRLPRINPRELWDEGRAIGDFLQNKLLTHSFGFQGEWQVRTSLVTSRQAWHYRSSVLVQGKEIGGDFSPIEGDWTHKIRQANIVTDDMLAAFARQAMEVHFDRCTAVADFSLIASIYSQPLPRYYGTKWPALALLSVAVLLTVYWLWVGSAKVGLDQPHGKPPAISVRWQPDEVFYRYPAGEAFVLPLPIIEHSPEGLPIQVMIEALGDEPDWLQLDRERLHIHGTAPLTAEDQTYRLIVLAHAEQGRNSRLSIQLTITGQPDRATPPPRLPGHWAW